MFALQIIKVSFRSLENQLGDAISEEVLGTFLDDGSKTAARKVDEFLAEMKPQRLRLEWDREVYPKFKIREVRIR